MIARGCFRSSRVIRLTGSGRKQTFTAIPLRVRFQKADILKYVCNVTYPDINNSSAMEPRQSQYGKASPGHGRRLRAMSDSVTLASDPTVVAQAFPQSITILI